MKKRYIIFLVLMIFSLGFFNKVKAVSNITSFVDYGKPANNAICTTDFCATDIFDSGIRVSLIDKYGNEVVKPVNFWSSKSAQTFVNGGSDSISNPKQSGYECTINFGLVKSNVNNFNNVYITEIGLMSNNSVSTYKKFIENLNSEKIKKIVGTLISSTEYEKYISYYLKIEPVYIIKEKYYNKGLQNDVKRCNYFVGTSREILNTFGSYNWNGPDNKLEYNGFTYNQKSIGGFYAYGGNNDTISGEWNVVRNYIVSMYYPCNEKSGLNEEKISCYKSEFTLDGKSAKDVIDLYINGGNGLGVGYVKISDYVDSCQSRANANRGNSTELIKLYREYLERGKEYDYRNLLNFNNPSCTAKKDNECNINPKIGCFSGSVGISIPFSSSDISCYTDTVKTTSGETAYCLTTVNITNLLGKNEFSSKSGQILINAQYPYEAHMKRWCFASSNSNFNNMNINSFETIVRFEDESYKKNSNDLFFDNGGQKDGLYYFDKILKFSFPKIYSHNGDGKLSENFCSDCKFLGYGLISKLNSNKQNGKISFTYSMAYNALKSENITKEGTCKYTTYPEIITKKEKENEELNLEFRIIDISNPFPGKNGTGRKVGNNWCNLEADIPEIPDINNDGKKNSTDLVILNRFIHKYPGKYDASLDINRDGIVNYQDSDLYSIYLAKHTSHDDCANNNEVVELIIKNANNSYNKNKKEPIYKIELDSSKIREIRKYNKNKKYDDYTLKCDDGENCKSTFLESYDIKRK